MATPRSSPPMQQQQFQVSEAQRERLENFFGEFGADHILRHLNDLEGTFGSAATIIMMVMDGKISSPKEHAID